MLCLGFLAAQAQMVDFKQAVTSTIARLEGKEGKEGRGEEERLSYCFNMRER